MQNFNCDIILIRCLKIICLSNSKKKKLHSNRWLNFMLTCVGSKYLNEALCIWSKNVCCLQLTQAPSEQESPISIVIIFDRVNFFAGKVNDCGNTRTWPNPLNLFSVLIKLMLEFKHSSWVKIIKGLKNLIRMIKFQHKINWV